VDGNLPLSKGLSEETRLRIIDLLVIRHEYDNYNNIRARKSFREYLNGLSDDELIFTHCCFLPTRNNGFDIPVRHFEQYEAIRAFTFSGYKNAYIKYRENYELNEQRNGR